MIPTERIEIAFFLLCAIERRSGRSIDKTVLALDCLEMEANLSRQCSRSYVVSSAER